MLHRRATSRSSRRYFEALLFSEIIKRTELDEDHSTEHRWGIFYHKYGPEIRRAAISLERIGKKKKEKKSANEREGRVSFFLSEAIGGKIEEKIIAKDSDWRPFFLFTLLLRWFLPTYVYDRSTISLRSVCGWIARKWKKFSKQIFQPF